MLLERECWLAHAPDGILFRVSSYSRSFLALKISRRLAADSRDRERCWEGLLNHLEVLTTGWRERFACEVVHAGCCSTHLLLHGGLSHLRAGNEEILSVVGHSFMLCQRWSFCSPITHKIRLSQSFLSRQTDGRSPSPEVPRGTAFLPPAA